MSTPEPLTTRVTAPAAFQTLVAARAGPLAMQGVPSADTLADYHTTVATQAGPLNIQGGGETTGVTEVSVGAAGPVTRTTVVLNAAPLIVAAAITLTQVTQSVRGNPGPPGSGTATPPTTRTLTWAAGKLAAVDYVDGRSKAMTYTGEQLTRVDRFTPAQPTQRADLQYNPDGTLAGVTESVI